MVGPLLTQHNDTRIISSVKFKVQSKLGSETRGVSSPGQGQAEIKTVLWDFKILWNIRIENIMHESESEILYVWDPNTSSSHII